MKLKLLAQYLMKFKTELSFFHVLLIGLLVLIIWANIFHIDQAVSAHGQVISEQRTQIIQAADGGVLAEVKVREGQSVKVGDILATLQKESALASYESALAEFESSKSVLNSIEEELILHQNLLKSGDIGFLDVARLKRQFVETQGRTRIAEKKLEQQQLFLNRTNLTAPVEGNVKQIKVNTVGGVLRAGEELMEISPTLESMVVEIKINTSDIGSIKKGMPAIVRLDAFDYATYGSLNGFVGHISSDSLSEPGPGGFANSYFRVHIDVPANQLKAFEIQNAKVKLGMSASVDIKIGSRSVMRYLLKPIYKGFEGALKER